MGTVLRVRYADIPTGRKATDPGLFADLGAATASEPDGSWLVLTLDKTLSPAEEAIARVRLLTPDDDQAIAAIEAADVAAQACTWEAATAATNAARTAALEQQVAALTTICTRLAQLLPNVPL